MNTDRQSLATLHFSGRTYEGNALDGPALREILHFQRMVVNTAKTLWRREHPDRKNLPAGFEKTATPVLRRIEAGSASAILDHPTDYVYLNGDAELYLYYSNKSLELIHDTFRFADRDRTIPSGVTRSLLHDYSKLGSHLSCNDYLFFACLGQESISVTREKRQRLESHVIQIHRNTVDYVGRVFEVNLKHHSFRMQRLDGKEFTVPLKEAYKDLVTDSLKNYPDAQIHVQGKADFDITGQLLEFIDDESLEVTSDERPESSSPTIIGDLLDEIFADIPEEEWNRLPSDLSYRHDHYIYGVNDE